MDHTTQTPMIWDRLLSRAGKLFHQYRFPFFSAILFGLLAHGFTFTNKLLNNDELTFLFDKGVTLESGRWGLELVSWIFPDFSMPWIYGIISIVLVAIAICIMVNLLDIRSKVLQILLAGIIITFPTLTATLIYMFTSTSYALSLLLAVLAAQLFCRENLWKRFCGVICLIFSLSIYQAYISVAASLLVLVLIRQVLTSSLPVKRIFRNGILFVLLLGISAAIYYGIVQLIFQFSGNGFGEYASSALDGVSGPVESLYYAYRSFIDVFFTTRNGLIPTPFSRVLHLLSLLVVLIEIIFWFFRPRQKGSGLLLLFLGGILPLAINCIYMISSIYAVHTLMLYSTVSVYLLAAMILDLHVDAAGSFWYAARRIAVNLIPICMALIILINTYIANEVSLKLYLMYENRFSACTSISTQLRQTPGYTAQTPVAILGQQEDLTFDGHFDHIETIMGHQTMFWSRKNYQNIFRHYLGTEINLVEDPLVIDHITATTEYANMPCYPDYGSIQMIDGTIVIRFS